MSNHDHQKRFIHWEDLTLMRADKTYFWATDSNWPVRVSLSYNSFHKWSMEVRILPASLPIAVAGRSLAEVLEVMTAAMKEASRQRAWLRRFE